jgi:5-methylcytosine-specific restriction protein A
MPKRAPQFVPRTYRSPLPKIRDAYYGSGEWKGLRQQCLKRDGYQCTAPDCRTVNRGRGGRLVADHIIERKLGGADAVYNLRTLCAACDNKRHGFKGYKM